MNKIGKVQPAEALPSQAIGRLASSLYYVHQETGGEELFQYFADRNQEIPTFGIVNDRMETVGVVDQRQFTALLSRPFGRDVLKNRAVGKIAAQRPSFRMREHIITVSEQLSEVLSDKEEAVFVISDEQGRFKGIFSTLDLLTWLSELTRKDIDLAHGVQRRIVRERQSVLTTNLEAVASATSAKGVGGDFYSVKKIGESTWFLAICDVSGKGAAASIVTAMLYGSIETFDFKLNNLVDFVSHVNRSIFSTFEGDKFMTGIFMVFDEESGKLTILDMGHSYFGMLRGDKIMRVATSSQNLPIGVTEKIIPQPSTVRLMREDILILLTDGLTEQQNALGEEYTLGRLFRLIKEFRHEGPESIRDKLRADFNLFRGDAPYHDDATFLLLRYPDAKEAEKDIDPGHTIEWEIA